MFVQEFDPEFEERSKRVSSPCAANFRTSMRATAASVALLTSCASDGKPFGMAVTSWGSLSMDPPSMLVAVNRTASVHSVISATRHFCLNLMGEGHANILERFSRSDMRDKRFADEDWETGSKKLPVLRGALASQICTVQGTYDYGTHTIFLGRVEDVMLPDVANNNLNPLIWFNGSLASLTAKPQT
jgi:flavin reductase (DIM6/NTAB) family NADH-FMN oxidoreductase RutF